MIAGSPQPSPDLEPRPRAGLSRRAWHGPDGDARQSCPARVFFSVRPAARKVGDRDLEDASNPSGAMFDRDGPNLSPGRARDAAARPGTACATI